MCGELNNVKGREVYECSFCDLKLDRDVRWFSKYFNKKPYADSQELVAPAARGLTMIFLEFHEFKKRVHQ